MLLALVALTCRPRSMPRQCRNGGLDAAGPTVCRFSGWTVNDKPAIVVRAEASATAKVVGSLPTTRGESLDPALDYYSVTFDLVEARDGWLKIKGASDEMSEKPRPVYQGEGWIEAGDMQVGVQSARGYARPDAGSERLLDLKGDWLRDGSRCAASSPATVSGCCWTTRCATTRSWSRWRRRTASGGGRGSVASAGPRRPVATCARPTRSGPAARRFAALVHASSSSRSRCVTDVSRASLGASQLRRSSM